MLDAEARERVIVALDCDREEALSLADALSGHAKWLKVGMTLYYAEGPSIVREFKERGFKVFLDLKFHDIPHQVRGAARSAAGAGADLLSVHGLGAGAMLKAAREGAEEAAEAMGAERAKLVAITVLTSMDEAAMEQIGLTRPIADEAARLAALAKGSGIDGIVCSPREAAEVRELLGSDALVTRPLVLAPAGAELEETRAVWPRPQRQSPRAQATWSSVVPSRCSDPVASYEAIVEELVRDA